MRNNSLVWLGKYNGYLGGRSCRSAGALHCTTTAGEQITVIGWARVMEMYGCHVLWYVWLCTVNIPCATLYVSCALRRAVRPLMVMTKKIQGGKETMGVAEESTIRGSVAARLLGH